MSTNVKIYRSTDAGAAAFTIYGNVPGTTYGAGGWIGVLKACLVDGYGSKTASSVTITSAVATFNSTAHGFLVGQCLLVEGATVSGGSINGEVYVTSITADSFTFAAPGISDQTATGTITAKVAPAGWTEPYASDTNITCFRQGGGNRFYLNIVETAVQVSRITGFESMLAVGVANGTNAFPTTAQQSGGLYINRSSTSSTAVRDWIILATDRHLYAHINYSTSSIASDAMIWCMSDLRSYRSGDLYATFLCAGNTSNPITNTNFFSQSAISSQTSGTYITRSYTSTGTSILAGKRTSDSMDSATSFGASGYTYPSGLDGSLILSPVRAHEVGMPRGMLPGVWAPCHNRPLSHLDTFTGSGDLAGKTFIALNGYNVAQIVMETSNTWSI
jgi:hypothetical protein